VLTAVNRLLCPAVPPISFVTVAYAVVDLATRRVTLASAGHLPPLIGGQEALLISALPLGVDPEVIYTDYAFTLAPGEPLLLFSDGLVEAPDAAGALPEMARLTQILRQPGASAVRLIDRLLALVEARGGGHSPADEITALVLIPPAELHLELPSRAGAALEAAQQVDAYAERYGPAGRAEAIASAVGEVCLNAVTHGNGERPELPCVIHLVAGPSGVEATVFDHGAPFDLPGRPPDLVAQMTGDGPIRGWGLQIVQAVADRCTVEPVPGGKLVRLSFHAAGGDPGESTFSVGDPPAL
jgi:anti-sigma regulatory factor (Ser/Thr protein kinase)